MTAPRVRDDGLAGAWGTTEFTERLRAVAEERHHHRHPFNLRMHNGELTHDELRHRVANRFRYQRHIPVQDALVLAKFDDLGWTRSSSRCSNGSRAHPSPSNGTNVGDYAYYVARTRATNDFHGLGAFLIMNEQLRTTHPSGRGDQS